MKTSRMWMGLSVAAVMATGCASEQESLIVLHVPFLEAGEDCLIDGSNDTIRSQGTLDLQFETPYVMPVILFNQLQGQTAMMTNNQVDNGELQLISADVTLSMPQAEDLLADIAEENPAFVDFTVDLSSISLASNGRTPVRVQVVSQPAAAALARAIRNDSSLTVLAQPRLLVTTTFHARRTGNRVGKVGEIDSREFTFPIDLCLGCLYSCQGCDEENFQACAGGSPDTSMPGAAASYYHCGNAQDFLVGPGYCENPNTNN